MWENFLRKEKKGLGPGERMISKETAFFEKSHGR
jgi:hypothetical protein